MGHKFCRYADDANIYVGSLRAGERVLESVKEFLEERLKLKVNEAKSGCASVDELIHAAATLKVIFLNEKTWNCLI